jgi:hypothetical protein
MKISRALGWGARQLGQQMEGFEEERRLFLQSPLKLKGGGDQPAMRKDVA